LSRRTALSTGITRPALRTWTTPATSETHRSASLDIAQRHLNSPQPTLSLNMAHNGGAPSRYQTAALTRNYTGCDQCHHDRKKCEGGVPCPRCARTRKNCTFSSQRENLNNLVRQTYGPNCFVARYINVDGYYAIYSPGDGCTYMQSLSNHFQPLGGPRFVAYDHNLDVSQVPYNVDFTVDDLLAAGRINKY